MSCRHTRKGIVTNQPDGYDKNRAHYSEVVCDRPECIRAVARKCSRFTHEQSFWVPDATRVAEPVSA